jgi:hypothetical protein
MVIDPRFPWKLPRENCAFHPCPFTMTAAEWKTLLARAEQGDAEAEWEVAGRYDDGCKKRSGKILVERSARKAATWFRRAAEHDCTLAKVSLGVLLSDGKGVVKNIPESLAWSRRAFDGGVIYAANNIAITYREIGNYKRAVYWFRRGANAGDDSAFLQLGIHCYWGRGVRKDPAAAVRCYRRAARGENVFDADRDDAFFYLGIAYLEGKGVKASLSTAKKLFQRANVDSDHPAARAFLQELACAGAPS